MNYSPKAYNKDFFDEAYYKTKANYNEKWTWENLKDNFLDWTKSIKDNSNPQRVLDVGCGLGFLVRGFRENGVEAYGVDVSQYAADQCDWTKQCDITEEVLPFPDNHFDLVMCQDILEHIPFGKHAFVFKELARVCKYRLVLMMPFLVTPEQIYGNYPETDESHISLMPPIYYMKAFDKLFTVRSLVEQPKGNPWDMVMEFIKK